MKKITLILLLLLSSSYLFSQIIPVADTENNDIYGYVIFQRVEKVDKKNTLYIASILDINLNKVAQSTFTDINKIKIGNVHYNGTSIYFEVIDEDSKKSSIASKDYSYRIYDLKMNKISDRFELPSIDKNLFVRGSYPIHGKGYGIMLRNFKSRVNQFYAVDNNNQKLYATYPYGNPNKKKETEHIIVGDVQNNMVASISEIYPSHKSTDPKTTLILTDALSGETIKEISFDNENFDVFLSDVQIMKDRILVFGDTYEKKNKLTSGKTMGMFKANLNLNGNLLDQKNLVWTDLQSKIDIKEGGFVRKKGYIYTHNYVFDKKTGHTIVVGEYINGGLTGIAVEDMVFLDFDENFDLTQVFEVETQKSVLNLGGIKMGGSRGFGETLKYYNYFDYRFSNALEHEDGLSFFYFNVEKLRIFSGDFSHGIVVFKDGKFSANKLKWETSVWEKEYLNLLPSKPGYILLSKITKDKMENRLERLDY